MLAVVNEIQIKIKDLLILLKFYNLNKVENELFYFVAKKYLRHSDFVVWLQLDYQKKSIVFWLRRKSFKLPSR